MTLGPLVSFPRTKDGPKRVGGWVDGMGWHGRGTGPRSIQRTHGGDASSRCDLPPSRQGNEAEESN